MTITSWLNFGRPAPSGRRSAAGWKILAPPYYSQSAVFASPPSAFFIFSAFNFLIFFIFKKKNELPVTSLHLFRLHPETSAKRVLKEARRNNKKPKGRVEMKRLKNVWTGHGLRTYIGSSWKYSTGQKCVEFNLSFSTWLTDTTTAVVDHHHQPWWCWWWWTLMFWLCIVCRYLPVFVAHYWNCRLSYRLRSARHPSIFIFINIKWCPHKPTVFTTWFGEQYALGRISVIKLTK